MKVLFISQGGSTCDYLRDCVANGMRYILGEDFVDINKIETLYRGYPTQTCYGRGFTLYGLLPEIPVDRTDIPRKIKAKYFDIVVYGSIHRCQDYLHEVIVMYPAEKIVYLDGEDHPGYLKGLPGAYFKRELHSDQPGVFPIQFGIPKEKILTERPKKIRLMAPMDPIDKTTYIYTTEESYYAQYAESYYAATMMKAGWDCMRHVEILSQWCIPYFRCFDQCPSTIMAKSPRKALKLVQECFDSGLLSSSLDDIYDEVIWYCMSFLRSDMTTEAIAKYVLDKVGARDREASLCS